MKTAFCGAIAGQSPEWLRDNFEMSFQYRHDTSRIDPALPFVTTLGECYAAMNVQSEVSAMPASSDAWFYNNILGIPTLATGCGNIADAHTKNEHVVLKEVTEEAAVLTAFIREWCGFRET